MLNERSQAQKTTYCMILCFWNAQNRQIREVESRLVMARGSENREIGSDCCEVSLGMMKIRLCKNPEVSQLDLNKAVNNMQSFHFFLED
jgi:hypothetical protein